MCGKERAVSDRRTCLRREINPRLEAAAAYSAQDSLLLINKICGQINGDIGRRPGDLNRKILNA